MPKITKATGDTYASRAEQGYEALPLADEPRELELVGETGPELYSVSGDGPGETLSPVSGEVDGGDSSPPDHPDNTTDANPDDAPFTGHPAGSFELPPAEDVDYESWTNARLSTECSRRHLPSYGAKAEMVARLRTNDDETAD